MHDDTKHLEGKLKLYFNCSESGQSDILSLSLQRNFSNENRAIGHVLSNIYVNIWRSTFEDYTHILQLLDVLRQDMIHWLVAIQKFTRLT